MINVDYPIIDGDGHVVEPDKEVAQYLPERFRRIPGNRDYSLFPQDSWAFGVVDPHKQDVPDAAMWLSFLDEAGISATVLYPSNAAAVGMVRRVEWSVDLARAYNDWLHDKFLRQSDRLLGVALLPVQDVAACVTELHRCVGELGFVGAILPSISSPLMAYGNPEFDPIFATAHELDTMIAVHGGFVGAHNFADPLRTYREVRSLKHVIPLMSHATSMISQGVFDRYPNLRVAYLEAGCGWVPYLMDVLDEQFERKGAGDLKRKPSEYLMDPNVYFSFEICRSSSSSWETKSWYGLRLSPRAAAGGFLRRPAGILRTRGRIGGFQAQDPVGESQAAVQDLLVARTGRRALIPAAAVLHSNLVTRMPTFLVVPELDASALKVCATEKPTRRLPCCPRS